MYAFTVAASCPAVCLGVGNCLDVCAHTAHFAWWLSLSFFLPHSVKDGGDLGGKERGTQGRDGSNSSQRPGHP